MNYVKKLRKLIGHDPVILVGAVTIIADNHNRILLQQRKVPYGKWGLPGGLMELEESTEETAKREVLEETGLVIGKLKLLEVVSGENCFVKVANGDMFHSVTIAYFTDEVSGELIIDKSESLDIKYFKISELPEQIVGSHMHIINNYIIHDN